MTSFAITPDDFDDGYNAKVDALTGRITAYGTIHGHEVALVLDEPLCAGCSKPFDANGFCAACEQYAENLFGTECLPDPMRRVA